MKRDAKRERIEAEGTRARSLLTMDETLLVGAPSAGHLMAEIVVGKSGPHCCTSEWRTPENMNTVAPFFKRYLSWSIVSSKTVHPDGRWLAIRRTSCQTETSRGHSVRMRVNSSTPN